MTARPMLPKISPEFRIAIGSVSTPIPMLPFNIWMMVSKFLLIEKYTKYQKSLRSVYVTYEIESSFSRPQVADRSDVVSEASEPSSDPASVNAGIESKSGGCCNEIEIVLRLNRSTSSSISVVDKVRCLLLCRIRGCCGLSLPPAVDPDIEPTGRLPYVLKKYELLDSIPLITVETHMTSSTMTGKEAMVEVSKLLRHLSLRRNFF